MVVGRWSSGEFQAGHIRCVSLGVTRDKKRRVREASAIPKELRVRFVSTDSLLMLIMAFLADCWRGLGEA